MQLSKIGEFGLIKKIQKKCGNVLPEVLAGIGDDAAVVDIKKGKTLLTTDMLIEGTHFDLSITTYYQLGYKFLAVNISDIFAMGGEPRYFLVSLGIPGSFKQSDIEELYDGLSKIARKYGVSIIGGDTCSSEHGLVLSGTLIGSAGKAVIRSGAKTGDSIYVTDTLGDSAMGLKLLKKRGRKVRTFSSAVSRLKLMKRHLMPEPVPLDRPDKATAMIDISDGLLIDLSHICDNSSVGAMIYKDRIPLSRQLRKAAEVLGLDPLDFALKGGEDYCLLFTARPNYRTAAHKIGEIIEKGRYIVDSSGKKSRFKPEGYEHFK